MNAQPDLTRRKLLATLTAAPLVCADDGWIELFDGRSLVGWRASENKESWTVKEGQLSCEGPRSHLFYDGPVHGADFRNFELQVEARAPHAANSGIYFHTRYQQSNFPIKGFEVQICNSLTGRERYQPRVMTGSLYGLRNTYKPFAVDDQWFKLHVGVRGKNIQIRLNGMLLVDYTEPVPPVIPDAMERERFLDHGTFALQCHDEASRVRFRSVRVRPLPDDTPTPSGPAPRADDVFRSVIEVGRHNIPMVDFHVHLKSGLTLEQALAKSRRDGIQYGIAVNCGKGFPVENEAGARAFVDSLKGAPVFIGMQAEGREWTRMFSRRTASLFDYVFTDAMTWTDNRGKRMRLWKPEEVGAIADPQDFMDTLVDRTVGILNSEPVDIYVNPTFLPAVLAGDYESLWTEGRRQKVIDAAVKNGVAIELNDRYRLPSASFVKMAKAAGAKFTFGTNNTGAGDLARCEYGLQMVKECSLVWQDFFVPLKAPKAIERRAGALKT
ncbi:MAG TPA: family 16 glycoside hydrolase [Bryobacteraceae bacterium]|nr:family 16 glycoside hydrolase [Bryobacteraceae bacterium]